nr:hypothetical protein [Neisseria meningitidis]
MSECVVILRKYSGLNLNQDKATKPQTVQIVRQGEATLYWFKFNPLYQHIIQTQPVFLTAVQAADAAVFIRRKAFRRHISF